MVAYQMLFLIVLAVTGSSAAKRFKNSRSSGVMPGAPAEDAILIPNEPWSFTLFGQSLPNDGWVLTSRSSCQDLDEPNPDEIEVPLRTVYPTDDIDPVYRRRRGHVTLRAMAGVPFKYDSREKFLICHRQVTKSVPMVIRSGYRRIDWWKCILVVILLVGSAFCSGTSIAFFTYNTNELLSIIEASIDETETFHAQRALWYRRKSNYLICCFAAANCIMNVTLTNLCEDIFKNFRDAHMVSMVASTCLTVALGEILPQGIGSRYGLWVASSTRVCTLFLFIIMAPFAYPLSKLTDLILGREARQVLSNDQVKTLLTHHATHLCTDQEGEIFRRTVKFQDMTIRDIMRPLSEVFALSHHVKYTPDLALKLVERGMYSRIPVYNGKNSRSIYACINMSDLLSKPKDGRSIAEIMSQTTSHLCFAPIDMKLPMLSEEMKSGQHHMAVVFDYRFNKNEVIGLVTSEDVWEQLFGDIQDDLDLAFGNKRTGIRMDQATLDWYREKKGPFTCNQQLAIIQQIYNMCPELRWMGLDVHQMRGLFPETLSIQKEGTLKFDDLTIYVICSGEFEGTVTQISMDGSTSDFPIDKKYHCDTKRNGRVFVLNTRLSRTIAEEYVKSFPSFPSTPPHFVGNNELEATKEIKAKKETHYFVIKYQQIDDAIRKTVAEDGPDHFDAQFTSKCRTAKKSPHSTEKKARKKSHTKLDTTQSDETIPLIADTQPSSREEVENSTQQTA